MQQWCRLSGFEHLDRLSSTNCLSWHPWQGNAWPYSWNPKRHFFSAMFSEQMRYILYFDQYQCRFGGCTHAACYFSAYYSIPAVVSACTFDGFKKNAHCLSIFYTYSASFFLRRRRAVLPTAVSLSEQLILFTSFPHVRGTRCQNAQNWCIYFLLLLKVGSWKKIGQGSRSFLA